MKIRNRLHHAVSALVIMRYRSSGMRIGENCLISRTAKLDLTHPRGISIGDNTAIAFEASILSHDFVNERHVETRIGSNCFIGGRSMIMPGVTVGDNAIVGAGSVVYADVEPGTIVAGNPARVVERGVQTGRYGMKLSPSPGRAAKPEDGARPAKPVQTSGFSAEDLLRDIFRNAPFDRSFDEIGVDSFELISIRARIETALGREISDADWERVDCPADLIPHLGDRDDAIPSSCAPGASRKIRNTIEIGMPQLGANGLSEQWLFKELGDSHWRMISGGLGVKTRAIADQDGHRLYATFTRIRLELDGALGAFEENDPLRIEGDMHRFGAGLFFSGFDITAPGAAGRMEMMSSFARFGVAGDNSSLTRGQPAIPEGFGIPASEQLPEFAGSYKQVRSREPGPAIFSSDYEIVPFHDINGVGLLYFAAYPAIHDICLARYAPADIRLNTVSRDICYFANSADGDMIRFDLEDWTEHEDTIATLAHLFRSDGTRMATVRSVYARS